MRWDRRAGRSEVRAADGSLVVKGAPREVGVRCSRALDEAFDRAVDRLRRTVGLERVVR